MRDWTFEYHRTFNGAGAVGEKHVFGSEARLAGKGCQTLAFVRRDICFFLFNRVVNCRCAVFLGLLLTVEAKRWRALWNTYHSSQHYFSLNVQSFSLQPCAR